MDENNQTTTQQTETEVTNQQPQNTPTQQVGLSKPKKSRKKIGLFASIFIFVMLLISAGAYGYFIYLPETPEMLLKKAAENFAQSPATYSVNGRLDNADPSKPDFDYKLDSDGSGGWKASISSFVVAVSPGAEIIVKDGKSYIKPNGFLNYEQLAAKYSNAGDVKTTVEYISDFAVYSGVHEWNDKWLEIPGYLFDEPPSEEINETSSMQFDVDGFTYEIGDRKDADGRTVQEYIVMLSKENMKEVIGSLTSSLVAESFSNYAEDNDFPESISVVLQVDVDTKQFYSLEYSGRPFADATFSFNAKQNKSDITAPETATSIVDALDYGAAWSGIIRPDMQSGNTEQDKERIADLKGMKLAFEIYNRENGEYPDRYSIAVNQESFLNQNMPFVDHQLFIDPTGRRTGLNGSQYAYVPEQVESSDFCGDLNFGPCGKFFLVTTLDDGTEYQLNSE